MEQIVNVVLNNGLGFASFIALIYFYKYALEDIKETNEEISKTLVSVQTSLNNFNSNLVSINSRIDLIENKINKGD